VQHAGTDVVGYYTQIVAFHDLHTAHNDVQFLMHNDESSGSGNLSDGHWKKSEASVS
jgi:hypothetical protein